MFTYLTLLISVYTVFYTIYCILPLPFGHRSSIYLYVYILIPFLYFCVYKVVVVKLIDYCTVRTRSTNISLRSH
jgi:4-hydroxybenzoate polyprenyltransferase